MKSLIITCSIIILAQLLGRAIFFELIQPAKKEGSKFTIIKGFTGTCIALQIDRPNTYKGPLTVFRSMKEYDEFAKQSIASRIALGCACKICVDVRISKGGIVQDYTFEEFREILLRDLKQIALTSNP